jgi:hypothetical protein
MATIQGGIIQGDVPGGGHQTVPGSVSLPAALSAILDNADAFLVFSYLRSSIFEEVFKRSSYIGSRRVHESTGANMLDSIALTVDDDAIFQSYLYAAAAEVFLCFGSFVGSHTGSYLCLTASGIKVHSESVTYKEGAIVVYKGDVYRCVSASVTGEFIFRDWEGLPVYFYTDDRLTYVLEKKAWFNSNFVQPAGNFILECLVNYILYLWFKVVSPSDAGFYYGEYIRYSRELSKGLNRGGGGAVRIPYAPLGR